MQLKLPHVDLPVEKQRSCCLPLICRIMKLLSLSLLLVFVNYSLAQQNDLCTDKPADPTPVCVPTQPKCSELYPSTFYPNNISVDTPAAIEGLTIYAFLVNVLDCSPLSEVFVCLALNPRCEGTSYIQPCDSLCDAVVTDCGNRLQGVPDPGCLLNCDRYPTTDCVGLDHPLVTNVLQLLQTTTPTPTIGTTEEVRTTEAGNLTGKCPPVSYFTDAAKSFSLGWLAFWSLICFLSTTLTIATFLLDTSRFPYPWRPVIYLALSFNIHSLIHFLTMAIGRDLVTCPGGQFVKLSIQWTWGHTPCILVFGLLYYTMMTAFLWWLMLSMSWFLASAFSWSSEAVAHLAPFYHVFAWVLPLLMTIILVATRVVGADELTGICFIVRDETNMSFLALLLGVIVPLIVCLVIGIVLLVIGFVSILRIRAMMRDSGKARESNILEKLIIRIGVFVVVFIIPACVVIGCFIYELVSRPYWTPITESCKNCTLANPAVFMVRLFTFLLTGILTGVWIWSRKTINSWKNFPQRLTACCRPKPEEVPSAVNDTYVYRGEGGIEL